MVVEQHPTLLNITMHTSKVGLPVNKPRLKPWQPPWMSDFRTKTIFGDIGPVNSTRNWRDGLRVYSDASTVMAYRLHVKTAFTTLGAAVSVFLSVYLENRVNVILML